MLRIVWSTITTKEGVMVQSLRATLLPFLSFLSLAVSVFSASSPASASASDSDPDRIPYTDERSPAKWEYHSATGARCRDGSEAAYYLKREGFDKKLLIYLEGGGACFNALTCSQNPSRVGDQFPGKEGIFADRDDNPLRDYNVMYVPYCTGDVFVGSRSNVNVPGVGTQQFVGHQNLEKFLDQVQKQLPEIEEIVLSGISAGGFGAVFQLPLVKDRWPAVPVTMLTDSGVPLEDQFLRPCLQRTIREYWGLNAILPRDCADCRNEDGGGLTAILRYLDENYTDKQHGVVLSTRDSVLRLFFGFSLNECRPLLPLMPAGTYEKGIQSLKQNYLRGNLKTYIVPGETHTYIRDNRFYATSLEGQSLASWVQALLDQKATDRGFQ